MVPNMPQSAITNAVAAEAATLAGVVAGLTPAELSRASPCPPWTIAELLCHVLIATGRIDQVVHAEAAATRGQDSRRTTPGAPDRAEPDLRAATRLVSTAGYYRPDQRFSPATNSDRIATAQALASQLDSAAAIAAELTRRADTAVALLLAAPPGQQILTRHGDRMLLTDFGCTRVVELGVHGLDAAAGLGRPAWLTPAAADVIDGLLLPAGGEQDLCDRLGCDRIGLIARLTGRAALSAAQAAELRTAGVAVLALG
jgi:Mycothiol maleylpyruvate isomerase N-terminal domain